MGIELGPDDWAVRCNLMTIRDGRLTDFTAGHITSAEGRSLIEAIQAELGRPEIEFHPGVSYRNLMVYRGQPGESPFTDETVTDPASRSPRSARGRPHAPRPGRRAAQGADEPGRARCSTATPSTRPASRPASRRPTRSGSGDRGRHPACRSSPSFIDLNGAIISAVDLVRGVGVLAGWTRIDVPGATGYLDTDYAAKGRFAHRGARRITTSSASTSRPPTRPATRAGTTPRSRPWSGSTATSSARSARRWSRTIEWRILISPDHSTLLRTRAHDRAPVAWAMAGTGLPASGRSTTKLAAQDAGGPSFDQGYRLMDGSST